MYCCAAMRRNQFVISTLQLKSSWIHQSQEADLWPQGMGPSEKYVNAAFIQLQREREWHGCRLLILFVQQANKVLHYLSSWSLTFILSRKNMNLIDGFLFLSVWSSENQRHHWFSHSSCIVKMGWRANYHSWNTFQHAVSRSSFHPLPDWTRCTVLLSSSLLTPSVTLFHFRPLAVKQSLYGKLERPLKSVRDGDKRFPSLCSDHQFFPLHVHRCINRSQVFRMTCFLPVF